ncbi:hypothetical protein NZ698_00750 [Chryseobacterium sp. PBS4-4]|uniref:Outer membrane protein beta-barrel domain-containing protein n=1 Tax=Chryseobacterium edaphi TaxID=2976532 RepID=A0ABT2W4P3_9FLAO|nr:hypothetical protein [Chryseobacterium edaphi]MCU7615710.1 hypothetical protein [Chryseobacterium edaphi]
MKLSSTTTILVLLLFSEKYYSQSDYSLGVTVGSGMNIYRNNLSSDKSQFSTNKPISFYFGAKLVKNLDEENKLFADLLVTRKKIEYEYNLNEPEIPFTNKEIFGQKYDCISLFVGYRRLFPFNENFIYIEGSVGADYNNNVMIYNRGNGQSQDGLTETIYYESSYNTNIGEKSYTISSNIGFGLNFGLRNQFDLGISINVPFQKIQTKESNFQYLWTYKNKEYLHQLKYIGTIYYPSLRLTYYVF